MDFQKMYEFLRELQKNNSKDWMDVNRKWYHEIRDSYIQWLNHMNERLAAIDDGYFDTPGKKAINRINNNLMFHPNKPVYKNHFGATLDKRNKQSDFYIHLGTKESFLASGYYHPETKLLKSIREAIDYNGEELIKILNKKSFKKTFGELIDDGDRLTNAPKGFSKEHPHIELLKNRTFAVMHRVTQKEVYSSHFEEKVIEVYKESLPFRRYLDEAVSV